MAHRPAVGQQQVRGRPADVAHGLVNAGQRGDELTGHGDVVVADDRHVAGDGQPAPSDLAHGADGHLVVGAEQGRGRAGVVEQAGRADRARVRRVALAVVHRLGLDQGLPGLQPRRGDGGQSAGAPVDGLAHRRRPVDEADPAVPQGQQVLDGGAGPGDVVARDRGQLGGQRRVVHEHDPDAAAGQDGEVVQRRVRGGDDDAAHVQSGQEAHELALAVGVGVGRAQHGHAPALAEPVLDPPGRLGEEGVGDVVDEDPHEGGPAVAQAPRRLGAHEAELGDGRLDPLPRAPGDPVGVVEHVGDRADGDAGQLGDVAHRGAGRT